MPLESAIISSVSVFTITYTFIEQEDSQTVQGNDVHMTQGVTLPMLIVCKHGQFLVIMSTHSVPEMVPQRCCIEALFWALSTH